jgi:hypothetical protein
MIWWWMLRVVTTASRNAGPPVPTDGMMGTSHRSSTPAVILAPMTVASIITGHDNSRYDARQYQLL